MWLCTANATGKTGSNAYGSGWYFDDHQGHSGLCRAEPIPGMSPSYWVGSWYATGETLYNCSPHASTTVDYTQGYSVAKATGYHETDSFTLNDQVMPEGIGVSASFQISWGWDWTRTKTKSSSVTLHVPPHYIGYLEYRHHNVTIYRGVEVDFNSRIDGHYIWYQMNYANGHYIRSTSADRADDGSAKIDVQPVYRHC